ncbi:transcription elongation factor A protein 2-like isoform X3 [Carassius gibelio]|uniref:transcription elongation factor A protein 2-like isoform X3 n=1 Tax=Carassius gibelio TaxID=101364 RepID=UPI002278D7F0|nr:transcription elongation factor A protein 2-like isoform X3 [Carassius gibelio]
MVKDQEVERVAKKLDKMVHKKNTDGAIDLLRELKNMKMSLETLQSTRIGMSVNAVRKQSSDEEVHSLPKSLIKTWKKLLDGSESKLEEKTKGVSPLQSSSSKDYPGSSDTSNKAETPKTPTTPVTPRFTTFPPAPVTTDSLRNKCRDLLVAALQTDDCQTIGVDCEHLAAQIEDYIYQEFKSTDMKYKTRLRSRISNLKDQKNPDLCQDVLCGNISADRIASMNAEEMASAELKEIRKALIKESILEHQLSKVCGTETDMFICGKCKGKNCNYTQVQTRSAGEPMTTFVLCNECGNRWKIRPHSLLIGENAANHRPAHILKSAFHGRETRQRSSQASQKSMFSSLYSVRRNSRNLFRPAGFFISLSKDCAHCLISSIVGLGLIERDREREREREREKLGSHGKGSSLVSWAFLRSRLSSSLLTVRLEGGKMALRNNSSA